MFHAIEDSRNCNKDLSTVDVDVSTGRRVEYISIDKVLITRES